MANGRILYIFTRKSFAYAVAFGVVGLAFYYVIGVLLKYKMAGIITAIAVAAIGYAIATFKMPNISKFEITKKTAGEKLDDIILRWLKFKSKNNRIYVLYTEEEKKNGDISVSYTHLTLPTILRV